MINILELFGGIRAPYKALLELNYEVKTLDYIENDPKIVNIANAMYETNYQPKSVIGYSYQGSEQVDLLIGGSPCQDFSHAGKRAGGDINSGTRSSLIWEQLRILKEIMPKYYIWENVKGVINKKNIHNFKAHNDYVEQLGYKVYYDVLNAKDFRIPQNRERVFVIAIRNDLNQEFNFNNLEKTKYRPLSEFLEKDVDNSYFIKNNVHNYIISQIFKNKVKLYNNESEYTNTLTTQPCRGHLDSGAVLEKTKETEWYQMSDGTRRPCFKESNNGLITLPITKNFTSNKVATGNGVVTTILTNGQNKVLERANYLVTPRKTDGKIIDGIYNRVWKGNSYVGALNGTNNPNLLNEYKSDDFLVVKWNDEYWNVRTFTELECYRLMAFSDEDFYKAKKVATKSQLYKVAGNSIVITVLKSIFKGIFCKKDY